MTDDEIRELIERDVQVQEMTEHPGWLVLTDFILERAEPVQRGLLNGAPKTIEKYRYDVGWFQGVCDVLKGPEMHSRKLAAVRSEHDAAR